MNVKPFVLNVTLSLNQAGVVESVRNTSRFIVDRRGD